MREYNRFDKLSEYFLEGNTYLTTTVNSGNYTFTGPTTTVAGIDITETQYNVSCTYTNTDSFNIVLGGCCDGGNCATSAYQRLHSINFLDVVPYINPVPVEMIYFNAQIQDNASLLKWATATEINNSHFEVQRSTDGKNWQVIGKVEGNGNSSKIIKYEFTDHDPLPLNYYRLKQIDYDGKFEYSQTTIADFGSKKIAINAFPNPTEGKLTISIGRIYVDEDIKIEIIDLKGNVIKSLTFEPDGSLNLITDVDLSPYVKGFRFLTDQTNKHTK